MRMDAGLLPTGGNRGRGERRGRNRLARVTVAIGLTESDVRRGCKMGEIRELYTTVDRLN